MTRFLVVVFILNHSMTNTLAFVFWNFRLLHVTHQNSIVNWLNTKQQRWQTKGPMGNRCVRICTVFYVRQKKMTAQIDVRSRLMKVQVHQTDKVYMPSKSMKMVSVNEYSIHVVFVFCVFFFIFCFEIKYRLKWSDHSLRLNI